MPRGSRPRLVRAACAVYRVTLWLYPRAFRRTFGGELLVTFRSRVEDVLEHGAIRDWPGFALHIAWDTMRASTALSVAGRAHDSTSLLGLCEGDVAAGAIDGALDIELLFAAAGVVLALAGWYAYFVVLPAYVG